MKLTVNKSQLSANPDQFLRQAGYGHIYDRHGGHDSYVRRLGSYHYPRLHMYYKEEGDQVVFNLHLDQKQASYGGSHMHNAEYDGENVAAEISRLKSLIGGTSVRTISEANEAKASVSSQSSSQSQPAKISRGNWQSDAEKGEQTAKAKSSWLKKMFG